MQIFLVAAEALSCMTSLDELSHGYLFPPFNQIRNVSCKLMAAVAAYMVDTGLGSTPDGFSGDWEATCKEAMWNV
jgi:malate dehydrogenase (oxaloacetate-decarboxylating)(NADP+)